MMKNLMYTKSIYTVLLIGLLMGCGKKTEPNSVEPKTEKKLTKVMPANPTLKANEGGNNNSGEQFSHCESPAQLALFMAKQEENPVPLVRALNQIALALIAAEDEKSAQAIFTQSLEVINSMSDDIKSGPFGEHALIDKVKAQRDFALAVAKSGRKERALATFKNALELAEKLKTWRDKILSETTVAMAESGFPDQAMDVVLKIKNSRINTYNKDEPLSAIAQALIVVGKQKKAREVVQQISDGTGRTKTKNFCEIARELVKSGDVEQALTLANQKPLNKISILAAVAVELADVGNLQQALQISETNGFNSTYAKISEKLAKAGKIKQAEEVSQRMIGSDFKGASSRVLDPMRSAIAVALAKSREVKQALTWAGKIESADLKAGALVRIADVLNEAGDEERSLAVLKQALADIQQIKNHYTKYTILATIATVQGGVSGQVEEWVEELISDRYKDFAFEMISLRLTEAGQLDQVPGLVEKIKKRQYRKSAVKGITRKLTLEPVPDKKDIKGNPVLRIKKSFTLEEKQLAKKLVEVIQAK